MIVTPDLIWQPAVDVLRRRHVEHLALYEKQRGFPAVSIPRVATVDVLAFEGARFKTDALPCILVGVFGTNAPPTRRPARGPASPYTLEASITLDFDWLLAMEVTVAGQDRTDTTQRRDWYTMTAIECLLARLPRHAEPVGALHVMDLDLTGGDDPYGRPLTLAQATVAFGVKVADTMGEQVLPPDDDPDGPGGAHGVVGNPYDLELPALAEPPLTFQHTATPTPLEETP